MRLGVLLLLCGLAVAGDLVHMRNGRVLKGRVVEESDATVVLDVGGGRVTLQRSDVRLVERGGTRRGPGKVVTRRDEWFLVLHRDKLVGWRRLVHTETAERVHVEERTVFFRPGGGDDVDIRRVEIADAQGRPLEFLLSETYGRAAETVSGQVIDGTATVRVMRDGKLKVRSLKMPKGWTLALPAWSRFLPRAKPGERRTITALDLRRLRPVQLVMTRGVDAAPGSRTLQLAGDFRPAREFYRPGEGSLSVELNGSSLIARRATREKVDLARRAHAAPTPLSMHEAMRYPFHSRPKSLTSYQVQAGLAMTAPDAAWIPTIADRGEGLVLSFEKVSLFASVEAFLYPTAKDLDGCVRQALARLRLEAPKLKPTGRATPTKVAGRPARLIELAGRHRGERLHCIAAVVSAKTRYVLLLGAAPEQWWKWARKDFDAFLKTVELVD